MESQKGDPVERGRQYRAFAKIALARATSAREPELRDAFARLADGWLQLADQVEASTRSDPFDAARGTREQSNE
jgi:hypothetical protein